MRDSLCNVLSSSNANLKVLPGGQDTYREDHNITGNRATAAFSRKKPLEKGQNKIYTFSESAKNLCKKLCVKQREGPPGVAHSWMISLFWDGMMVNACKAFHLCDVSRSAWSGFGAVYTSRALCNMWLQVFTGRDLICLETHRKLCCIQTCSPKWRSLKNLKSRGIPLLALSQISYFLNKTSPHTQGMLLGTATTERRKLSVLFTQ